MSDIFKAKRDSASALLEAIDEALAKGSLVLDAESVVAGRGIPLAFKSREDMVAERDRLAKMIA